MCVDVIVVGRVGFECTHVVGTVVGCRTVDVCAGGVLTVTEDGEGDTCLVGLGEVVG